MSQTLKNACHDSPSEADALAPEAEAGSRLDHLHAFNFGRSVGRMEQARGASSLRIRWLLLGAALGVTLAVAYFQIFQGGRILPFAR